MSEDLIKVGQKIIMALVLLARGIWEKFKM